MKAGGAAGGAAAGGSSMKRHMRVSAEMSALSSLAVHWGSSVLVRQDPARCVRARARDLCAGPAEQPPPQPEGDTMLFTITAAPPPLAPCARSIDYMRAAMTGPPDTPYQNGVWLFDVFLPAAYPAVPPSVQFLTTAGGRVRSAWAPP